MKLKSFFEAITIFAILVLAAWLAVSFVDMRMHNNPVYGDKQYMPGNAIVIMMEMTVWDEFITESGHPPLGCQREILPGMLDW